MGNDGGYRLCLRHSAVQVPGGARRPGGGRDGARLRDPAAGQGAERAGLAVPVLIDRAHRILGSGLC
jgi:hypothetical protein